MCDLPSPPSPQPARPLLFPSLPLPLRAGMVAVGLTFGVCACGRSLFVAGVYLFSVAVAAAGLWITREGDV
jgi:hypothetical protein